MSDRQLDPASSSSATASNLRSGNFFHPVRVPKAADEVIIMICDAVRSGVYRPGQHLPTQVELADQFEVSRNVVREAVEALRRAGIVSVRRGSSDGVRVESTANLHQVITAIGGHVHSSLLAALQARRPLELTAALLTAERATPDDLHQLSQLVSDLATAFDDPDDFLQIDAMYHFRLAELSGNPLVRQFLRTTLHTILADERTLLERLASTSSDLAEAQRQAALDNQRDTHVAISSNDQRRILRSLDNHLGTFEQTVLGYRLTFAVRASGA